MFPEAVAYKLLADVPIPTSALTHPDRPSDKEASADENSCALCCRFCVSEPAADSCEGEKMKNLFWDPRENRFNLIKFNEVKGKTNGKNEEISFTFQFETEASLYYKKRRKLKRKSWGMEKGVKA